MSGAVFDADGARYLPAPESRARWYAETLHGGPVAALVARAFEAEPAPVPMMVTRMTVDLMRPVTTAPIEVTTRPVRTGRRIQVLEASLDQGGTEVVRATGLRIRTTDLAVPDHPERAVPGGPDGLSTYRMLDEDDGDWFHTRAVEMRFVDGDFYEPGPATVWARLTMPIVAGEEATPLQRVAAMADFGNGLSRVLPFGWLFINPDLTIHLDRLPESEWICLRSRTDLADHGVGLAQSELFDTNGAIGHALQGLLIDRESDWR